MSFLMPLADVGTPLMWASALHLIVGNLVIGIGEGWLIARIFKVRVRRAILWMIPANYFSMIFGLVLFNSAVAARFSDWFLGDAPLYRIGRLLLVAALLSYVLTIFLEWPFVVAAMWKTRHGVGRTFLASLIAQTASYFVMSLFYGSIASLSLITVPTLTIARDVSKNPTASVYFIDGGDQLVYQLPLDGSARRVVGTVPKFHSRPLLALIPNADGLSMDLCLAIDGQERAVVLPKVAPLSMPHVDYQLGSRDYYFGGPAVDCRSPGAASWAVRTGNWPFEGLSATNAASNEHMNIALETPFVSWWSRSATILPGDQVIYEVGEQVVLLDLSTKRMERLARGYCPVVILAGPATASQPFVTPPS